MTCRNLDNYQIRLRHSPILGSEIKKEINQCAVAMDLPTGHELRVELEKQRDCLCGIVDEPLDEIDFLPITHAPIDSLTPAPLHPSVRDAVDAKTLDTLQEEASNLAAWFIQGYRLSSRL